MESEKKGMPRFALSEPSIGSITTRVRPLPSSPTSSERIDASTPSKRARITRSAAASIAVVSSPPSPWESTGSRSARVGRSPRTARTSSAAPRHSASQSVKREEEESAGELREEVGGFLRQHLAAARALEHGFDRRRPDEQRSLRVAAVDGRLGVLPARRVRDAFRVQPLDELDIQAVAFDEPIAVAPIDDDARQPVVRALDL